MADLETVDSLGKSAMNLIRTHDNSGQQVMVRLLRNSSRAKKKAKAEQAGDFRPKSQVEASLGRKEASLS
jgi:hypothetical protein